VFLLLSLFLQNHSCKLASNSQQPGTALQQHHAPVHLHQTCSPHHLTSKSSSSSRPSCHCRAGATCCCWCQTAQNSSSWQ